MNLFKSATIIILIATSLYAKSVIEQGYDDGRKAIMNDSMMNSSLNEFKNDYEDANTNSDRYILKAGLRGAVKGSCMRLTYGSLNREKLDNKEYDYINAFKKGCWSILNK